MDDIKRKEIEAYLESEIERVFPLLTDEQIKSYRDKWHTAPGDRQYFPDYDDRIPLVIKGDFQKAFEIYDTIDKLNYLYYTIYPYWDSIIRKGTKQSGEAFDDFQSRCYDSMDPFIHEFGEWGFSFFSWDHYSDYKVHEYAGYAHYKYASNEFSIRSGLFSCNYYNIFRIYLSREKAESLNYPIPLDQLHKDYDSLMRVHFVEKMIPMRITNPYG